MNFKKWWDNEIAEDCEIIFNGNKNLIIVTKAIASLAWLESMEYDDKPTRFDINEALRTPPLNDQTLSQGKPCIKSGC